jgi:hypothetical protein
MNKPMHELQKMGCGLLLGDSQLHRDMLVDIETRKYTKSIYITNCLRLAAALKLLGGEVIEENSIKGIEVHTRT